MSKLKTHQLQLIRVIVMGVTIATMSSHNQAMQLQMKSQLQLQMNNCILAPPPSMAHHDHGVLGFPLAPRYGFLLAYSPQWKLLVGSMIMKLLMAKSNI